MSLADTISAFAEKTCNQRFVHVHLLCERARADLDAGPWPGGAKTTQAGSSASLQARRVSALAAYSGLVYG
jgi:hypothetical protein